MTGAWLILIVIVSGIDAPMASGTPSRTLLDGYAARVNNTVILESDISIEQKLIRSLADFQRRESPSMDREMIMDILIERALFLEQARKFITRTLTESDIDQKIAEMDAHYGGPDNRRKLLDMLHLNADYWRLRARDQLMIERYIAQRVEAFIRITEQDEDTYINAHADALGLGDADAPAKAVPADHPLRKVVKELLTREAVEQRKEDLIRELRASADVSFNLSAPPERVVTPTPDK